METRQPMLLYVPHQLDYQEAVSCYMRSVIKYVTNMSTLDRTYYIPVRDGGHDDQYVFVKKKGIKMEDVMIMLAWITIQLCLVDLLWKEYQGSLLDRVLLRLFVILIGRMQSSNISELLLWVDKKWISVGEVLIENGCPSSFFF